MQAITVAAQRDQMKKNMRAGLCVTFGPSLIMIAPLLGHNVASVVFAVSAALLGLAGALEM